MNNIRKSSVEISNKLMSLKGWFEDIQFCSLEVFKIVDLILNNSEKTKKILVEITWEIKELEKLKIDSSNWEILLMWWLMLKINHEWDIIEYIDWQFAWEQLFTWNSAFRETKNKWMKLLKYSDFHSIIYRFWVERFFNFFFSFYNIEKEKYFTIDSNIFLWTFCSFNQHIAYYVSLKKNKNQIILDKMFKNTFLFAFWIKD